MGNGQGGLDCVCARGDFPDFLAPVSEPYAFAYDYTSGERIPFASGSAATTAQGLIFCVSVRVGLSKRSRRCEGCTQCSQRGSKANVIVLRLTNSGILGLELVRRASSNNILGSCC